MRAALLYLLLFAGGIQLLSCTAVSPGNGMEEEDWSAYLSKPDAADNLENILGVDQSGDIFSAKKKSSQNVTSGNAEVPSVPEAPNYWFDNHSPSYIKDIYDYMRNIPSEFAKTVRSVIIEEFYELLNSMWELIVKALSYNSDFLHTLWSKIPRDAADTIMAIGLIMICSLLNYIFWKLHLGILFILAFDGSVYLTYKFLGPTWIYSTLWYLIGLIWNLVSFLWDHPYILAFVIVIFYLLSLIIPVARHWRKHRHYTRLNRMEEERQADGLRSVQMSIALLAEEMQHSSTETIRTLTNEVQDLRATLNDVHLSTRGITALRDEVKQLKAEVHTTSGSIVTTDEVQQLKKAAVCEVTGSIATLTDEVQQLKTQLNEIHSMNADLMELVQQLKATVTPAAGSTVNQVPLNEVSSSHSCNAEQHSPRQRSRRDTPVSGERMIWGTQSSTVEQKVAETIARLTSVSASDFTITKKYSESVSRTWWFVISAEESVLLKLQEKWHLVKAQTHWKLKKAPTDQASSYV